MKSKNVKTKPKGPSLGANVLAGPASPPKTLTWTIERKE